MCIGFRRYGMLSLPTTPFTDNSFKKNVVDVLLDKVLSLYNFPIISVPVED